MKTKSILWGVSVLATMMIFSSCNKRSPLRDDCGGTIADAVDMGLSVKWASWNVGASAPAQCGNSYAWGEVAAKSDYNWDSYKWAADERSLTKYNTRLDDAGTDKKTVLDASDDAATANWGEDWRTPTNAEWEELLENSKKAWTKNYNGSGVKGYIVTSNITGNSIFFPAAGISYKNELQAVGSNGYYWSSSLKETNPNFAWRVDFLEMSCFATSSDLRIYGHSIRPVCTAK
ncbi:MAG: hypothetical protein IKR17_01560 [Bacteroidales bacterium]|nr:hypothetical protein [Bacteroidales bacterium]